MQIFLIDVITVSALIILIVILGGGVLSLSFSGRKLTGLSLLAYSAGFGILLLAALGFIVVSLPTAYWLNATIGVSLLSIAALALCWRFDVLQRLALDKSWVILAAVSWFGLASTALAVALLPVQMPNPLPDGAYVIKNEHLHVKIQRILGDFPADNYVPFIASEFLLRDIQFSAERPLMPGQELSNRPILMSLSAIPVRALLRPPHPYKGELPKFSYVGIKWPNVAIFGDDRSYRGFLRIGVVLNATLVLALILAMKHLNLPFVTALAGSSVFISSPYFLGQTLFIWPKSLAAFFLLLSLFTLFTRRRSWVAGMLSGAAYWSHPYAIVYVCFFALYLIWRERNDSDPKRGFLPYSVTASAIVLSWIIWSQLYLRIPSDLVQQNLFSTDLVSAILNRVINLRNTILPPPESWFDLDSLCRVAMISLMGGVGVFLSVPAAFGTFDTIKRNTFPCFVLVIAPCALLILVFGVLALPAIHGAQILATLLLVSALKWLSGISTKYTVAIAITQTTFNFALLVGRGLSL